MTASVYLSDYSAGSAVLAWLVDFFRRHTRKPDPDLCLYDREAWARQGHRWGGGAAFSVVVEGAELSVLRDDPTVRAAFTEEVERRGFFWEMGDHLTYHLYPIEASPS